MGRPKRRSPARPVRHLLVYWAARAASGFLAILPCDLSIAFARFLGRIAYLVVWTERRRALDHLRLAFGDSMSEAERRRIARRMFANFGNVAVEVSRIPRLTPDELRRRVRVVDPDKFRHAIEEGRKRGLICVTAHLGAWEYIAQYGVLVAGMPVMAVAREQSNPLIQTWSERVRCAHGVQIVYRKKAGVPTFRFLRQGKGVGILLDQCTKGEGVFVPFFGRPAHTLTGPARLALRTGALLVPLFMIREHGGRQLTLHALDPIPLPDEKKSDQAVYQLTARLTSIIEDQIRRWPDQWVWIHRRWKRTPETDKDPVFDPADGTVAFSRKDPRRHGETPALRP